MSDAPSLACANFCLTSLLELVLVGLGTPKTTCEDNSCLGGLKYGIFGGYTTSCLYLCGTMPPCSKRFILCSKLAALILYLDVVDVTAMRFNLLILQKLCSFPCKNTPA